MVVVLAVALAAVLSVNGGNNSDPSAAPSSFTQGPVTTTGQLDGTAEEDAVQAAAEKRVQLINGQDAIGLHDMACAADSQTESVAGYRQLFDRNGSITTRIDIQDITVNGTVGKIDGVMTIGSEEGEVHWAFRNEEDQWRFCPSLSERSTADEPDGSGIITG